jgi:hypothetical protein
MRIMLCALLVLLCACQRVVDLEVPSARPRLVVAARLARDLRPIGPQDVQVVKLTTTSDYFSADPPPPALGAVVQVQDDMGNVTVFSDSLRSGMYRAPAMFVVQRGRTYTLTISFEGEQYQAVESTQNVAPIQRLYLDKPHPGRFAGVGGLRATIDYTDPAGVKNFYMWEQYLNGVLELGPDSTTKMRVIASDQLTDGLSVVGFQPYEGVHVEQLSQVVVRQIALSEAAYQYFYALNDQVSSNGSPFAVPPASLRGNIQNLSDRIRPALGYFYVSEISSALL